MTPNEKPSSTLQRFFAGIAEHTFQVQLGVVDPPVVDYLTDLLMRFLRTEAMHRMRSPRGRPLTELTDLFLEASKRIGTARREIHRHIGDLTLFWTGLFPESLRPRGMHEPLDRFVDYCEHGKRAYLIASTIEVYDEEEEVPSEVLERLGRHFEMCAYGLREVRREWERQWEEEGPGERPFLIN